MDHAADTTVTPLPEPALLAEAIARGEAGAEARFVQHYRPVVLRLLVQLTRDAALAEDLTHDTMIVVLQKLRHEGLREAAKLGRYATRTARFQYLCWLRKSANRVELTASLDDIAAPASMPEHQFFSTLERERLHRSINDLKVARDREILTRHYLHGQSKPEICEALLLSSQHFDRVISRARSRLKEGLRDQPVRLRYTLDNSSGS